MSAVLSKAKSLLLSCLKPFDVAVTHYGALEAMRREVRDLRKKLGEFEDKEFLRSLPRQHTGELRALLERSRSQIRQDLFVLSQLGFKRGGYFVEFGASGGIEGSNTYLLEREFGWTGILAEPARIWRDCLKENRSAAISSKCVWNRSHEMLSFNEVESPWLSTIESFSASDSWAKRRAKGKVYEVETISLEDLLAEFSAPIEIDYLSIDTEGSEFDILKSFNFAKHRFSVITCEHNFAPIRESIHQLLVENGYVRKFEELSQFDDWYLHGSLVPPE